ncbi:hypothetical protein [Methylorubrum suomiense]|uniref:Uncharacterized protein n=1 Tax=Methylorubrum suomiense TaxID=144191 RepID=A0ABQ4UYF8_9HYPH|nr:hypothetical protein [Methylorubrum suomiense]GJE77226.1 hypothetical protein BGCPKDLD_3829 [Methylorubrum suomiense]
MFTLNNRSQEQDARAYCERIGADADEIVSGYVEHHGAKHWTRMPRWRWYLGASEAAHIRPI